MNRGGSSRKLFEPRANRAIDCRVGSSRVILRFEVRANRVKNRVKIFFFESKSSQKNKCSWVCYPKILQKFLFFLRFVYFHGKHKKTQIISFHSFDFVKTMKFFETATFLGRKFKVVFMFNIKKCLVVIIIIYYRRKYNHFS